MCNICNIRLPQAIGDVISSIGIGTAAADSIRYRAPAWYRSNPTFINNLQVNLHWTSSIVRSKAKEVVKMLKGPHMALTVHSIAFIMPVFKSCKP